MKEDLPEKDLLWKQYELKVDLYKFHLDLAVKFSIFYYAVTGTILSFYFAHSGIGVVRYALLFPVLMSVSSGAIFIYTARLVQHTRNDIGKLRDQLGLASAPNVNVLALLLKIFAALMLVVAVGLTWLFFHGLG